MSGAAAVRVPRVPGHPLNFDNGCEALILRKILDANKRNLGPSINYVSTFEGGRGYQNADGC